MLSHPRSADFARDAIRVFRPGELEDQDQMCLIDFRHTSRQRTCVDDELHALPRRLHRRVGHRVTQAKVIDDEVHEARPYRDPTPSCSGDIRELNIILGNYGVKCADAELVLGRGIRLITRC